MIADASTTSSIWILEDHEVFAKQIRRLISNEDDLTCPHHFSSAAELFDKLKFTNERPDLLLLDLGLPRRDGLEVLADIRYDRIVPVAGDKQRRFGTLLYLPAPPAKFSIHFDRLLVDRRTEKQDRWYIFDGQWLVERLDDKKQFFKRQIISPKAAQKSPDQADPLGSGNGPFIVPLSLKKDRVLARFVVSIVPNKKGDPENTTQLLLVPKPESHSEFTRIHIWVSDETMIPIRVYTVGDSGNESVIDLTDVKVNDAAAPQTVDTSEPKLEDKYQVSVTPWAE